MTMLTRSDILTSWDSELLSWAQKVPIPDDERCCHCQGLCIAPPEPSYVRWLREQCLHAGFHKRVARGNPVCCHCNGTGRAIQEPEMSA